MTDKPGDTDKSYRKRKIEEHELRPETQMMGYGYDPHLSEGSLKIPLFQTSTFIFKNAQEGKDFFDLDSGRRQRGPGEEPGLIYSRFNNPDMEVMEDRLALWEEAEMGLAFSSGMGAISTTLFSFLRPGDVIVHSSPVYGATEVMIRNFLPEFGIKSVGFMVNASQGDIDEVIEKAKAMGRIGVIYTETPANPTSGLVDLEHIARIAKRLESEQGHKPVTVTDNTYLGPLWQKPLRHGIDIVVYSLTKYVGGHSDLVAGGALGSRETMAKVRKMRSSLGTNTDPHTGWLLMRSMETLKLRMTAAMKNARQVAEFLEEHPKVKKVHYLGFLDKGDPLYEIYNRQCASPGSTFSFDIDGGEREAFKMLDRLQVIKLAVSLGGTESLISHPASTTHSGVAQEIRNQIGISDSLIRISVGIEHPSDLIADLDQALRAV